MGLAENPSWLHYLYKNPETDSAVSASAEIRRGEEEKEEASPLPRWSKDAKENVSGLRSVASASFNPNFIFTNFSVMRLSERLFMSSSFFSFARLYVRGSILGYKRYAVFFLYSTNVRCIFFCSILYHVLTCFKGFFQ